MDPERELALRALDEAAEAARSIRIDLTPDYLALIAAVEALPQNQPGSDKSHCGIPGLALRRASRPLGPFAPRP
jgi:hypothetical protein